MNRTSRTDEPDLGDGYNQSPNALSNDLTTNQDLNGLVNSRSLRRGDELSIHSPGNHSEADMAIVDADAKGPPPAVVLPSKGELHRQPRPGGEAGFQVPCVVANTGTAALCTARGNLR